VSRLVLSLLSAQHQRNPDRGPGPRGSPASDQADLGLCLSDGWKALAEVIEEPRPIVVNGRELHTQFSVLSTQHSETITPLFDPFLFDISDKFITDHYSRVLCDVALKEMSTGKCGTIDLSFIKWPANSNLGAAANGMPLTQHRH
jgi:hypothetical protein